MPRKARQPAPLPKEVETHVAIADALRWGCAPGWLFSHFPAGEHRSSATGALLQRMGLKRGWSDFVLIDPTGLHYWLELKRGKASLRKEQRAFGFELQERGVPWAVARSFDEAVAILTQWGALRLRVSA